MYWSNGTIYSRAFWLSLFFSFLPHQYYLITLYSYGELVSFAFGADALVRVLTCISPRLWFFFMVCIYLVSPSLFFPFFHFFFSSQKALGVACRNGGSVEAMQPAETGVAAVITGDYRV